MQKGIPEFSKLYTLLKGVLWRFIKTSQMLQGYLWKNYLIKWLFMEIFKYFLNYTFWNNYLEASTMIYNKAMKVPKHSCYCLNLRTGYIKFIY